MNLLSVSAQEAAVIAGACTQKVAVIAGEDPRSRAYEMQCRSLRH